MVVVVVLLMLLLLMMMVMLLLLLLLMMMMMMMMMMLALVSLLLLRMLDVVSAVMNSASGIDLALRWVRRKDCALVLATVREKSLYCCGGTAVALLAMHIAASV